MINHGKSYTRSHRHTTFHQSPNGTVLHKYNRSNHNHTVQSIYMKQNVPNVATTPHDDHPTIRSRRIVQCTTIVFVKLRSIRMQLEVDSRTELTSSLFVAAHTLNTIFVAAEAEEEKNKSLFTSRVEEFQF